jgi:phage-related tail protein
MDNLLITGLPMTVADTVAVGISESSTRLMTQFIQLCNDNLHCDVQPSDISTIHRLPSRPGKPSLTVVRFARRLVKERVYYSRAQLKTINGEGSTSSRIYINEDIVGINKKIFNVARDKLRSKHISGVWTRNCKIMVRKLDGTIQPLSTMAEATLL